MDTVKQSTSSRSTSGIARRLALLSLLGIAGLAGQTPTGYWSFDASTINGTAISDLSGNGLTGTNSGATSVSGAIGQGANFKALNFNGSNASVLIPNDGNSAQLTTNLTLAVWINTTATSAESIISKYDATGQETGYLLHTSPGGTVALRVGGNNAPGTTIRETFDTTHVNDGNWHHIAVVITQGVGLTFYVDGALSSTWPMNIVSASTNAQFTFGITGFINYGNYFAGSMDEVYLFRQALTASQIFSLYANTLSGATGTTISNVVVSNLVSNSATVSWNTTTSTDTQLAYGLTSNHGLLTPLNSTSTVTHSANLSGLQPSTQYHFSAQSRNSAGVLAVTPDATFTTTAQSQLTNSVSDTSVSDFSSGGGANTYVSHMVDGEVMLAPAFGTEWSGNSIPPSFVIQPLEAGGYATVGNNMLSLLAARLTGPSFTPIRSMEFVATFTQDPDEHIGFAVDLQSPPWAIFSTQSNRAMNIRTNNGISTKIDQLVPGNFSGSPHLYRIDWTASGFTYSIDGVQVGTHALPVNTAMNPLASDNFLTNGILTSNYMHVTPYASTATFTSRVLNANVPVGWSTASWDATLPAGTSLQMSVRIGNTPIPDGTWTAFQSVSSSGGVISGSGQYIQYKAVLSTTDPGQTPVLSDVSLQYNGSLSNIQAGSVTPTSAVITWSSSNPGTSQVDYGTSGYTLSSTLDSNLVTSHSVTLMNLTPSQLYHFRVDTNSGMGVVSSGDFTFNTPSVPDMQKPTVSITAPPPGNVAGTLNINANAMDNVGVVSVQFLIDNANFGSAVTVPQNPPNGYQIAWNTATIGNGPHMISATASDAAGNTGVATAVAVTVSNPTTQNLTDTTVADFTGGSGVNTYISQMSDGEVIQNPALGTEFNSLPLGWTTAPWATGGAASVSLGSVNVDGALYAPGTYYLPGSSLQFVATFTGDFNQHVGLGNNLQSAPWAIFSTAGGGTTLYIRSNNGSQNLLTPLVGSYIGSPHQFRIDWTNTGFIYWIDGVQVGTHAVPITQTMRPMISDLNVGGGAVTVNWMHLSPYSSPATFTSRVFNAGTQVGWNTLSWDAITPANTSLAMSYRTGNTAIPDGTWTSFAPVSLSGGLLAGASQYIQYQAALSTTDATQTVVLQDVTIQYNTTFSNIQANPVTTTGATIGWTTSAASTSQVEYGTGLTYGYSVPSSPDPAMVTTHSEVLTNLQTSTLYHYRVKSFDGVNLNISGDNTFTTAAVPDLTAPSINMTAPSAGGNSGLITVSASASDNVGVTRVQFLLDSTTNIGAQQPGQGAGPASYSIQWDSTTVSNGPHTLSAIAFDAAGNHTTATAVSITLSNSVIKTITDTAAADFSQGSGTNFYISQTSDGEVIQAPTVGAEFTTFPAGWTSSLWGSGGGITISNGIAKVDGAIMYTNGLYGAIRSLEFVATFGGDSSQHVGFANDLQSSPWAIFSTFTGGALYARTNNGIQSTVTLIPGSFTGTAHKFRIDWISTGFVYWIDGVQVLTDPIPITQSMRPMASDFFPGGTGVQVDWMHMTPYSTPATFTSRVMDGGVAVNWTTIAWDATLPAGTSVAVSVRTGNTATPDGTWTAFTPISTSGGSIGKNSRYVQYQVQLSSSSSGQTAVLSDVTVSYTP